MDSITLMRFKSLVSSWHSRHRRREPSFGKFLLELWRRLQQSHNCCIHLGFHFDLELTSHPHFVLLEKNGNGGGPATIEGLASEIALRDNTLFITFYSPGGCYTEMIPLRDLNSMHFTAGLNRLFTNQLITKTKDGTSQLEGENKNALHPKTAIDPYQVN